MSEEPILLYCPTCLVENPIFSMAGHAVDVRNLACEICKKQIARMKKNTLGEWILDTSFYSERK